MITLNNVETSLEDITKALTNAGYNVDFIVKDKGRWEPEVGGPYWVVDDDGDVFHSPWGNDPTYKQRYNMGNVYRTCEEAELARDRQLAYVRITDALREAEGDWKVDWNNSSQTKHHAVYYHTKGDLLADWCGRLQAAEPALISSKEAWESVIKSHEDDLKLWFGVE